MTRGKLPRGQVRVQWTRTDHRGSAKFTIPVGLARMIDDGAVFQPELVEDGVLFRYVEGQRPVTLPRWLTE